MFALLCFAVRSHGELTMKILASAPVNSGRIISMDAEFRNSSSLMEVGWIETTAIEPNGNTQWFHRSQELIFPAGKTVRSLVLPACSRFSSEVQLSFRWATERGSEALGTRDLAPRSGVWSVLCVSSPGALEENPDSLMATRFPGGVDREFSIADTLPTDPYLYGSYDAVAFEAGGFRDARDKSLLALSRWIDAGGRVFIAVDGLLGDGQRNFLEQLQRDVTEPANRRIKFSKSGELLPLSGGSVFVQMGKGRANIYTSNEGGFQKFRDEVVRPERQSVRDSARLVSPRLLLPGTPQPLSIRAICGIMMLFIFVVAPLDFFVLGRLKRHRWTWRSFCLSAIGFTWWMAHFANSRMSAYEQIGVLRIVDIGSDDRVLSTELITATLPATTGRRTYQNQLGIHVPSSVLDRKEDPIPRYDGAMLGHHSITLDIKQWTPQIRWMYTIGGGEKASTSNAKLIDQEVGLGAAVSGIQPFGSMLFLEQNGSEIVCYRKYQSRK